MSRIKRLEERIDKLEANQMLIVWQKGPQIYVHKLISVVDVLSLILDYFGLKIVIAPKPYQPDFIIKPIEKEVKHD